MRPPTWAIPVLVALMGDASAEPPAGESVSEHRVSSRWNRHRAGGADNRRTDVRVVFVRDAQGAVQVFESGVDRDFSMNSRPEGSQTRLEIRRWLTTWAGTWTAAGDDRRLRLERRTGTCTLGVSWDARPTESRPCPAEPEALDAVCTAWRGDGAMAGATGWRCAADGLRGHTTLPWIVTDGCVVMSRGPRGRPSVRPCPPDPGPPPP